MAFLRNFLKRRAYRVLRSRAPAIQARRAAANAYVDRLNSTQRQRLRFHRQYSPTTTLHRYDTPNMIGSTVMQAAGTVTRAARRFLARRQISSAIARAGRIAAATRSLRNRLPRDAISKISSYL